MPGITNNLYPPLIQTWMPAFVRTAPCKVYFSLSDYNSIEDIQNAQVIVNYQNNNLSALDTAKYPTGIKIVNIDTDNSIQGNNKYYITISPSDLNGGFELNQFYKIQIRFTGIGADSVPDAGKIASWLANNQPYFSEWSTVCIIKGIEQPLIYIKGFDNSDDQITFNTDTIHFVGNMYYEANSELEKEYLKSYQIDIYNNSDNELVYSSGIIYTEIYNPNEINYIFPYLFEDGTIYRAVITYTTNNEYQGSVSYIFNIIIIRIDNLNATIVATAEEEYGRIKVEISSNSEVYLGNLAIRRTSNKSDFKIWEDVQVLSVLNPEKLDVSWYDYTVESGTLYKYCAQKINSNGMRGATVQTAKPVMIVLDNIFLTQSDFQLRVRYDPSISSFKHTLSESVVETIGSKYPFFKRNGKVNYRQFPISGLITHFCDDEGVFLNKDNIYLESRYYYDKFNEDNNITEYQDYIYERKFREKVIDFLYQDNVKLFRSTTEGNILIKLVDVSFTPNETLGRMIYTFTATAYEVDECSFSNYNKYNILHIGEFNPDIKLVFEKFGQKSGLFKASENILTTIQNNLPNSSLQSYVDHVEYLTWLRITFEEDPYPVKISPDGSMEPILDGSTGDNCTLGYIVYINNNPIFVNKLGYYELNDNDIVITSVYFPVETDAIIDYVVQIARRENEPKESKMFLTMNVGQVYDVFNPEDSIVQHLYSKYHETHKDFYQDLLSIDKISIEALPGTVVLVKDSYDEMYDRHVIGETSRLSLYKDDAIFIDFYVEGMHLVKATDDTPRTFEFVETGISVENENEIQNIVINGVYLIGGNRMIYYDGQWYPFNANNDVKCPMEVMIDYEYELLKREYQTYKIDLKLLF